MKEQIAKDWIKALRSGKYEQTTGTLKDGKGYCCLGVLCDISNKGSWKFDKINDTIEFILNTTSKKEEIALAKLPISIENWAGMSSGWGSLPGMRLTSLNDQGKSFFEIADLIEKHWQEL